MTFEYVAVDTETTGLDSFHKAEPFLISTLTDEGTSKVWEFDVDPKTRKVQPAWEQKNEIVEYLDGKKIVFHHAKFDLRMFSILGINFVSEFPPLFFARTPTTRLTKELDLVIIAKEIHDTQLLSHVVNSQGAGKAATMERGGMHGLKPLGLYYLDIPERDERELHKATVSARRIAKKLGWPIGSQVKADYWMPRAICQHWREPGVDDIQSEWATICSKYAYGDVYRTLGLFFFLQEILKRDKLEKQYHRELRLMPVTYLMEHHGMHVHKEQLDKTLKDFQVDAESHKEDAEKILCNLTDTPTLNANSGPQLSKVLGKCGLDIAKRTAKDQVSTDASCLRNLAQFAEKHSDVNLKLAAVALRLIVGFDPDEGDEDYEEKIPGYRTFVTGSRYLGGYYNLLDSLHLLHPSFNQVGTSWTRYSSSDPNGQNVSKKAILPLRRVFGPPPGYVWLAVDYEQLELRIFAYASQEQRLIEAFESGQDFHTMTATEMYGVPADQITSEQRRGAKYVNFGIIYGAGPAKTDQQSGRPGTYNLYMERFPNAKDYMAKTMAELQKVGYILTMDGYRLYIPEEKPHACVNARVQGTAGEIVKNAMVDIHESGLVDWEYPSEEFPYGGSSIVANIHDELVFQFPLSYPYRAIGKRIIKVMEAAGERLGVKTPCDAKLILTNWAEGEKFAA